MCDRTSSGILDPPLCLDLRSGAIQDRYEPSPKTLSTGNLTFFGTRPK
ncbi:hypothetical protein COO91_01560 [Nostoc flagelliforme CCNUN1]|uniref:Uncharacterized protein n=1 Tax=Nostoc flagelliforme CCNUN1 TaxID=2038116 RepID=A0A2K8SJZ3_9NOSO|nr:hypothetical protein COO91_01560 [Nostoc flagelliforme CCNUN1]